MIELNEPTDNMNLTKQLSLKNILYSVLSNSRMHDYNAELTYKDDLQISERIGYARLNTAKLIYYPALCQNLRNISEYPAYSISVSVKEIFNENQSGIQGSIEALQSLNEALKAHREQKALLDAKVNNLIMLYGQHETTPIFNGSKPHYNKYDIKNKKKPNRYIIYISGVRYFNYPRTTQKYRRQKSLYELSCHDLLEKNRKENNSVYGEYKDPGLKCLKALVGGIINTPILIFRSANNYKCKGKYYYLNLHTKNLTSKLSEAREMAKIYAKNNYKIDIFERTA